MSTRYFLSTLVGIGLFFMSTPDNSLLAQNGRQLIDSVGFSVDKSSEQIELPVNTSRSVTFEHQVPELTIDDPSIVRATPVAANEIILTGLKTGMATLTVADPDQNVRIISVNVVMDLRKLEFAIRTHFPTSNIRLTALQSGIMVDGTVARAEDVELIMAVARDFVPTNVINKIRVDGSQTVAIEVRIFEVSRTKLRNLGVDWRVAGDNFNIVSGFADVLSSLSDAVGNNGNARFGIFNDSTNLNVFLNMLEQKNVAKLMASPTLTTQNGRPAEFLSGGEIPFQSNAGFGATQVQFRPFGTKLDVVPVVEGEGEMILEVRAEVSEVAPELDGGTGVPGFRVRRVNTSVPIASGQTIALAGDYREKSDSEIRGMPGMVNKAGWGALFRNSRSEENETELVFVLTPRFVAPVDAGMLVEANMPGRRTVAPSNRELYFNGYVEVPRCEGVECPGDTAISGPGTNLGGFPVQPTMPIAPDQAPATESQSGFGYPDANEQSYQQAPAETPEVSMQAARGYFQPSPLRKAGFKSSQQPTPAQESSRQRFSQYPTGTRR
jgi:pilus assembly protein CpaC